MREPGPLTQVLADEAATRSAGAALARALEAEGAAGAFVTLTGDLGAGKTTLERGVLEAHGVTGPVRSPTYTLVESYAVGPARLHHLDWYRLSGVDDLEGIGFRDLQGPGQWLLVEWPQRVAAVALSADLALGLDYDGAGRRLTVHARSGLGARLLAHWKADPALD